ncbi:hypothetical protein HG537_0G02840 [Torulaspora globosa]|uniref:Uncharacterized protein n=1 Tax=Torulaspora globosa TaxID=48254 RepID=A0A7H9HXD1_9SACH|nr:hypothetical protein HG537_0G02840 [Torulaspora sp. CBS 2947]
MENVITQVSQSNGANNFLLKEQQPGQGYSDNGEDDNANSLIHLNIQENHYYITRDQLMSLPESLLLCLFPSGVFLDRQGQVISNLMPNDEVYVSNFPPDCFEYIMEVYSKAYEDLINFPVHKLNDRRKDGGLSAAARGFFSFGGGSSGSDSTENEILHEKPTIIVLREDLDYYCVPQSEFEFDSDESSDDLLYHVMAQVKAAAGSYLTSKGSIFQGLYSSNRLKKQKDGKNNANSKERTLGPAEQHLLDMLCSSGFAKDSRWENRTQEPGKTVISSLSLCRIVNETTEEFRQKYHAARLKWEQEVKAAQETTITPVGSSVSLNSLTRTVSRNNQTATALSPTNSASQLSLSSHTRPVTEKRKSRLSTLADNVRSRSSSAQRSTSKTRHPEPPRLYDLVPRPDINPKLLLFWRKPARKCWWGEEKINLEVQVYGSWSTDNNNPNKKLPTLNLKTPIDPHQGLNKISIPVRLHIRRVWTLELSAVGVE